MLIYRTYNRNDCSAQGITLKGGASMATSSIFANVKITDPRKAEAFINALDAAANAPKKEAKVSTNSLVTDTEKIKMMMAKRKKK